MSASISVSRNSIIKQRRPRVGADDVGACALRRRTEPRARWVAGSLSSQHPVALVGALFTTPPPAPVKLFTHISDSFSRLKHQHLILDATIANPALDRVRVITRHPALSKAGPDIRYQMVACWGVPRMLAQSCRRRTSTSHTRSRRNECGAAAC